jgi:hypothetical protein
MLSIDEGWETYATAVRDRSRRMAADFDRLNKARRILPPAYRDLRVLRLQIASPWHVLLDLGPTFAAAGAATRLLFYLVEQAFVLPLRIQVQRAELRRQLEALRDEAQDLAISRAGTEFSDEVAAVSGGPESNDPLTAAVTEIRAQREDAKGYDEAWEAVEAHLEDPQI